MTSASHANGAAWRPVRAITLDLWGTLIDLRDPVGKIERRREINAEGLERLAEILAEHGFDPVPSVGNFVYVDVGGDAAELFERLLREGVIVRPLTGFGSPTAIRVSVGTPDELDEFGSVFGHGHSDSGAGLCWNHSAPDNR